MRSSEGAELRAENRDHDTPRADADRVLAGGGEMGALMRSVDWAATAIGPVEGWSQVLRHMVGLLLRNRSPLLLWWGPRFVQLYNDAYRPVLGDKHPRSMGQPTSECWHEIWHIIGPMIEAPFRGEPATTSDDLFVLINRKGFVEETHFRVAYSPVPDDTVESTGVGGVLATVTETTEQVYGERQLRTLRELGARAAEASTAERACEIAAETLAQNGRDVPFALFYLMGDTGERASLVARVGFGDAGDIGAPREMDLTGSDQGGSWPVGPVIASGCPEVLEHLAERFPSLPTGAWARSPGSAIALPLSSPDQPTPYGVMICGVSPHRVLDAGYRTFFELAAAQVVTAIRNARAHQAARRRAEQLAEIDRAKTAFFSNVSHEFRTPLTLMLAPTEDLLAGAHGEISPAQRAQLELLRRNELRLQRLVNALLEFSRIEAGRVQATFEPTDLAVLTRDIASSFRAAIERASLTLTVDCQPLEQPVFVDRGMWEQIVLNLLSNAFKFTFEGEIGVSLRAAGDAVILRVGDTGVGVHPSEVPRLFERFHRIEGTRARTHEGSGIGLALVQELARLHGGTITAESALGVGTSFEVAIPKGTAHLPKDRIGVERAGERAGESASTGLSVSFVEEALRWLPDEPEPARGDGPPSVDRPAAVDARGARVLVADDNADMREYLRRILAKQWTVETVGDGAAALRAARARRPDVILTDAMMPGLDGFRLIKALREDASTSAIPILMLSARAGEESRVEGLYAGADDYLVKPFSARELVARIAGQIDAARLRSALEAERAKLREMVGDQVVARRQAEEERQAAKAAHRKADFALRARDEFLSIASHELRTPLTTLGLQLDGLLKLMRQGAEAGPGAQRVLERLQRVREQADRLEHLIEGVMDVFGHGKDHVELACEDVDLADVVKQVIDQLRSESREGAVDLTLSAEPVVGLWDPRRLHQIAMHLLSNALKFGAGKAVRTVVEARGETARLCVVDAGIGIAPEHQERIFGRFERATPGSDYGGFGLGLWIVRELVAAMRGSVRVVSEPGRGATFIVDLPRRA